jgi:L-fuconolactonase
VVFEAFGTERLMIGSDWPVCTLSAGYVETMNVVLSYIAQLPQTAQNGILGGNCARFYRLGQ